VVSFPRQAAATLRVVSSELSEFSNSGTHRRSATPSNCPWEQFVTTFAEYGELAINQSINR
jgi:hypothetical protein